jgi:hypothetical protein
LGKVTECVNDWNEDNDTFVYPRILINQENVQYGSDNLTISYGDASEDNEESSFTELAKLEKFKDYYIYLR